MTAYLHRCAARNCPCRIKVEFLMCARHWAMVPRAIQNAVYRGYRLRGLTDHTGYDEAVKAAVDAVCAKEKADA